MNYPDRWQFITTVITVKVGAKVIIAYKSMCWTCFVTVNGAPERGSAITFSCVFRQMLPAATG